MRARWPSTEELRTAVDELEDAVARGAHDARVWLASPQGRRFRSVAASALILSTPLILRHPFFRTPLGRIVELAGAAAVLAKVAEEIREWEPIPEAGEAG